MGRGPGPVPEGSAGGVAAFGQSQVAEGKPPCYTGTVERPSPVWPLPAGVSPGVAAAALGAGWGLVGYALLWGHTPLVVHRTFVVSPVGTLLLLPVRAVLLSIHAVEGAVGRPFELADSNGWIGLVAAVVGAGMAAVAFLVGRSAARWLGRAARGHRE